MPVKKLYTKKEFLTLLEKSAEVMAQDRELSRRALDVLVRADQHRWIHQTSWMGEPILNLPQDMFALQEIIFQTRPEYIIEVGVAWGGAMLFYSTLMEILGGKKIIGIDIYIPDDLGKRLRAHKKLAGKFVLLETSSIEKKTVQKVKAILKGSRKVLVVLDSFHTHEHVLKELELYSPLVGKGYYLVCGDTIVEDIPAQTHRLRPWGPGNNPKTALHEFLKKNKRFVIDRKIENKLLLTCNPDGYLKCMKD